MKMDIDLLIDSVFKRPPIWNRKDNLHGNRTVVDKCWKQISVEMKEDELKLRKKWKYLRDQFAVELGKILQYPLDDTANNQNPKWPHFQQLLFLKNVVTPRASAGSTSRSLPIDSFDEFDIRTFYPDPLESSRRMRSFVEQNEVHIENVNSFERSEEIETKASSADQNDSLDSFGSNENITSAASGEPSSKMKKVENEHRQDTITDEHLLFFKSLLPHVRKIPQRRILSFRSRIQELVEEFVYRDGQSSRDFDNFEVRAKKSDKSMKFESDSD